MPRTIKKLESQDLADRVGEIAMQVRKRRKALGVSATAAAEAAGVSRVTWYRIEKGETSVTVAAWLNALSVLGLAFRVGAGGEPEHEPEDEPLAVPVEIRLERFPQLAALAWQVREHAELTPREAWDIYRLNERHLDKESLSEAERRLLLGLESVFGEIERSDV